MKKALRYSMFGLLYFAQGAIMSFFTALNAVYLQSFGLGMGAIGIIGTIAMVPFVIKIFLGMLSDKVNFLGLGFRKPYIILGLFIQAICLILVPFVNPGQNFLIYAGVAFILMMGMALYDTCTDGLALDTTPPDEEGVIQGYMVGGRAAGMVVVSALLGIIVQRISWMVGFYFLAAITLAPLPLVLLIREVERPDERLFDWSAFKSFKQTGVIALGVLGALYSLIINGASQLVNPFLTETFNIDYSVAGFIASVIGLGIVAGGFFGGRITDNIGQRKSLLNALVISLISVGMLAVITGQWMAWVLVVVFGFGFRFYETVYFAISMRITDGRIAATMFSIMMAVANIGTGIGLGISGALAEGVGYRLTFLVLAAMNLLALPLIQLIFKKKTIVTYSNA